MRKVTVNASKTYDIVIEKGILNRAGELCRSIVGACRVALITDSNVEPLYADKVEASLRESGFSVCRFVIRAGEESKCADNYLAFISFMAQNGITRSDCIIALGGGVVGDLAGFAAATYLRGISFIQIPTTLLAMVDSSVGGKTAIDIPEGKNLLGAFYQPSLVICDCEVLSTLPPAVFADGCAEVLKYGIINNRDLWEMLKNPIMPQIEDIIERCVQNKRDIVCQDERDKGVRQLLNLGHTAAHAIEILSSFSISHGSAVAMGIVIITRASTALGLCSQKECDEIISLISSYFMSVECPYSAIEISEIALSDKKRMGKYISLIMPYGIGNSKIYKIPVGELGHLFSLGLKGNSCG